MRELSDWRLLIAAGALLAGAVALLLYRLYRRPQDPEEEERRRRFQLNQVGRIVEGLVVDIVETPGAAAPTDGSSFFSRRKAAALDGSASRMRRLVLYSYSISGVTYETAQDVTGLQERLRLERLAAGQPASIKYDPANPSNSILVADDWSGID